MENTVLTAQGSSAPSPSTITGIGARLKGSREALRLSPKEVAARLRLNTQLIDLMEKEEFSKGPPATFMRGYLRSYARFLNLDETEIKNSIDQLNLTFSANPTFTPMPAPKQTTGHPDLYLRWTSYVVIAVLVTLVLVWWVSHPRFNAVEPAPKPVAEPITIMTQPTPPPAVVAPTPPATPAIAAPKIIPEPQPPKAKPAPKPKDVESADTDFDAVDQQEETGNNIY